MHVVYPMQPGHLVRAYQSMHARTHALQFWILTEQSEPERTQGVLLHLMMHFLTG
jgi:hypothetical protein